MSFHGRPQQPETHETWFYEPNQVRKAVRPGADHPRMETTLHVLAWAGVVAAAAVTAALVVGMLFSS
jgi:hypothetical protein